MAAVAIDPKCDEMESKLAQFDKIMLDPSSNSNHRFADFLNTKDPDIAKEVLNVKMEDDILYYLFSFEPKENGTIILPIWIPEGYAHFFYQE
jgi:hypothetical protein